MSLTRVPNRWEKMLPIQLAKKPIDEIRTALEEGYDVNTKNVENNMTLLHFLFSTPNPEKILLLLNRFNPDISLTCACFNRTVFFAFTKWEHIDLFFTILIMRRLFEIDKQGFIIRHVDTKGMNCIQYHKDILDRVRLEKGEASLHVMFLRQIINLLEQHYRSTDVFQSLTDSHIDDEMFDSISYPCSSSYSKNFTQRGKSPLRI